jgi:hypothetical protein
VSRPLLRPVIRIANKEGQQKESGTAIHLKQAALDVSVTRRCTKEIETKLFKSCAELLENSLWFVTKTDD